MVLSQDQQACFRTTKKYARAQERLYGRNVKILKMTRIFSRKWLNSQILTVINGWHRQTIDKSYQEEITIFLQQFNLICWKTILKFTDESFLLVSGTHSFLDIYEVWIIPCTKKVGPNFLNITLQSFWKLHKVLEVFMISSRCKRVWNKM